MQWTEFANEFLREESGQDLLEYALVLATVLAACVAGSNSIASVITSGLATILGKIGSTIS